MSRKENLALGNIDGGKARDSGLDNFSGVCFGEKLLAFYTEDKFGRGYKQAAIHFVL